MKSSRHSARAAWARCISRATRGWSALVAVKVLNAALVATPEAKTRFEREAKTISQLNHPNICTLYDVGHQDGIDYLVMEFLEGETLSDRLKNRGALPLQEFTKIGSEIAEALDKAHRAGIVHRDLKPGNVILTKSGAKLLDFGLAKPAVMGAATGAAPVPLLSAAMTTTSPNPQQSPLTQQGSLVGTVQYMSPEQFQGLEADARSDIFALGAVLYEMASGKRAFDGKSQIKVASAILEDEPPPVSTIQKTIPPIVDRLILSLYVRAMNSLIATPLAGTDGAIHPFWSPDSKNIAFFSDGKLKRMDASGGPVQELAPADRGRGAAWSPNGTIVYAPSINGPLMRVPASGGTPAPAAKLLSGETGDRWPSMLPDGNHFVFWMRGDKSGICVGSGSRSTPPTTACRCGRRTAEKSSMSRIERARTTFI